MTAKVTEVGFSRAREEIRKKWLASLEVSESELEAAADEEAYWQERYSHIDDESERDRAINLAKRKAAIREKRVAKSERFRKF